MKKLQSCWCGGRPRQKKILDKFGPTLYNYSCNNCENHTFSTKILGCAAELWEAAINNRRRNKGLIEGED